MRVRVLAMVGARPGALTGDMTANTSSAPRTGTGVVLGAATVATGLVAGVFYIFACAVMPALRRSGDRVFVEVMRNINDVIQNPVFFLSFMGALVLTAVSAWQLRHTPAALRDRFEDPWVAWNAVRALLSTAATACLTRALVRYGHAHRRPA